MLVSSAELEALKSLRDRPWYVGFSGGADSTALLHFLSTHFPDQSITAIHVNHQLSQYADKWAQFCEAFAASLQVQFVSRDVVVGTGEGLEAEARRARYQVFEDLVGKGCLMLGHHLNDQAETFLFRALRGEALAGLAAIPKSRGLGSGVIYRPLLAVSRNEIERYLVENNLTAIEDESNSDLSISRNYIRHALMPDLLKHAPNAIEAIGQSTEHLQSALSFQDELLAERRQLLSGEDRWGRWISRLEGVRDQVPWLNGWFRAQNLAVSSRQLKEVASFFDLGPQSKATVKLGGVRRICWSGKRIYLVTDVDVSAQKFSEQFSWSDRCYEVVSQRGGMPLSSYHLAPLDTSLSLRVAGREGTKSVNKWLKEMGVPWFARASLPAIMDGNRLVAVADLLIAREYTLGAEERGYKIHLVK